MSVIDNRVFKAEIPRTAAELIPDNYSQEALNGRLLSGNLEAWNDLLSILTLPKGTNVVSIHLMARQYWLHWLVSELGAGQVSVDVAKGAIPADTEERTYFTGTVGGPRVTNLAMATTSGSGGGYPYASLKLGVPAPATAPTLDQGLFLAGFIKSAFYDGSSLSAFTIVNDVTINGADGNPAPSFRLTSPFGGAAPAAIRQQTKNGALQSFAYRFDVQDIGFYFSNGILFSFGGNSSGKGFAVNIDQFISIGFDSGDPPVVGTGRFSPVSRTPSGIFDAGGGLFRITVVAQVVGDNTQVSVSVLNSTGALIGQNSTTLSGKPIGEYVGYSNNGSVTSYAFNLDNIINFDGGYESLTTNYVYTFVNEFGEEGAPSKTSATISYGLGETIVVDGIADPSPTEIAERGIVKKYLYRAVTGDLTTQFQFVAEILVGTTTYTDTILDADTGEALGSQNYDLPPDDAHSILALPNAITVMASKNQIVPSAQNRPHAYPIGFRLTADYPVVALGAIDTNVIVATAGGPYLVIGSDPAALSMSKLELPQGCVSKRSLASIKGFGVLYASPDGLVAVNSVGNVQVVTEKWLTRRDWQAFKPESIIATVHDDRYFGSYDTGTVQGTFVFDPKDMGWMPFDFHFNAEFYDTYTDRLFLVTSANNLQAWDEAVTKRPYTWKSKSWLLPRAESPAYCRVRARDYTAITLTLYDGSTPYYTKVVTSEGEFPLPARAINEFSFKFAGTSRVTGVTFVEDVAELR